MAAEKLEDRGFCLQTGTQGVNSCATSLSHPHTCYTPCGNKTCYFIVIPQSNPSPPHRGPRKLRRQSPHVNVTCIIQLPWISKLTETWTIAWLKHRQLAIANCYVPCFELAPNTDQDAILPSMCQLPGRVCRTIMPHSQGFYLILLQSLFCAKLKQCVVLAWCILYKTHSLPPPPFV